MTIRFSLTVKTMDEALASHYVTRTSSPVYTWPMDSTAVPCIGSLTVTNDLTHEGWLDFIPRPVQPHED